MYRYWHAQALCQLPQSAHWRSDLTTSEATCWRAHAGFRPRQEGQARGHAIADAPKSSVRGLADKRMAGIRSGWDAGWWWRSGRCS